MDLLGGARAMADATNGRVAVLALGAGEEKVTSELIARGADDVLTWSNRALASWSGEAGVAALVAAAKLTSPDVILMVADSAGRDWAPRLAFRLGAGLITEATGWKLDEGKPVFTRMVFGGKAHAVQASRRPVSVATVKPGATRARPPDARRTGNVRPLDLAFSPSAGFPVLVETAVEAPKGPRLDDARIIVSGGRGLSGSENFSYLHELAEVLGRSE